MISLLNLKLAFFDIQVNVLQVSRVNIKYQLLLHSDFVLNHQAFYPFKSIII